MTGVEPDFGKPLTDHELTVLTMVAHGDSSSDIAAKLFIGTGTVSSVLKCCYAKLGARNRAHAVMLALRKGLLPED